MITKFKDGALSRAIKSFLNNRLAAYGKVRECQIDTANNRLLLTVALKGESDPINAALERYEIVREEDGTFIRLKSFSCSREWLGVLLNQRFVDKQYRVPGAISSLL